MKIRDRLYSERTLPDWAREVKTAIEGLSLELGPGIELIPPPEVRTVFKCLNCSCQVATCYETISVNPLRIRGRCGMCYRTQEILA